MIFNPSRDEVRRFFCEVRRKQGAGAVLTPLEALAADLVAVHPEYDDDLADLEAALARDYSVEEGRSNPFLHLAMHLAIAEQLQVDQPPGIRAAVARLAARRGDEHGALHEVMEVLGEVMWTAQRAGTPVSVEEMHGRYVDAILARASRD
jgi:Domain of unknown function (DUF1841)